MADGGSLGIAYVQAEMKSENEVWNLRKPYRSRYDCWAEAWSKKVWKYCFTPNIAPNLNLQTSFKENP